MAQGIGNVPLENIRVAAPCDANWATMPGDERVRHCALCRKNVYNLSDMTRNQIQALIQEKEGRLCVRFYQRADGTMLVDNCPVGLRSIRRRLVWIGSGLAALIAFGVGLVLRMGGSGGTLRNQPGISSLQNVTPFNKVIDVLDPPRHVAIEMGEMCVIPTPAKPAAPAPARSSPSTPGTQTK